jgi:hypothetical protein
MDLGNPAGFLGVGFHGLANSIQEGLGFGFLLRFGHGYCS